MKNEQPCHSVGVFLVVIMCVCAHACLCNSDILQYVSQRPLKCSTYDSNQPERMLIAQMLYERNQYNVTNMTRLLRPGQHSYHFPRSCI